MKPMPHWIAALLDCFGWVAEHLFLTLVVILAIAAAVWVNT